MDKDLNRTELENACSQTVKLQETEEHADQEREDEISIDELAKKGQGPTWWLEEFYEHFRIVPLKALDIFIVVCVLALISIVAMGVLKAKGIL